MPRILLVNAAVAIAATLFAGCSDPCDCPLKGQVAVEVSPGFGQYGLTVSGTACSKAVAVADTTVHWTITFFDQGECLITVTPRSGTAVSHNLDVVKSTDTETCCPNSLIVTPPQAGPIQFAPH